MPQILFDHVHLRCTDPEAAAQWFESMLGGEVRRSMQSGRPRVDVKLGGANIFLAPVAEGDNVAQPPVAPYRGLDHFGLFVTGLEDVVAEMVAKGVEVTVPLQSPRPGISLCFIRGPEGISIELLERTPTDA
jgi:catechol 2,3-dioxygenase-like lactoylglutathione lyase family enzyme